jgi:hypothetical protein
MSFSSKFMHGHRIDWVCVGAVVWGTSLQVRRLRVRFPIVSLEFFFDIILPAALWHWGWLSLWQKWVPGTFPGGKGGRCVGLTTLPPSCADCLKNLGASTSWKPQDLSRPVMGLLYLYPYRYYFLYFSPINLVEETNIYSAGVVFVKIYIVGAML